MSMQRAHPITIVGNLWRVFYLLVIPLLRGFVSALRGGFANWVRGTWMDILIVSFMIAIAVVRWRCVEYRYDEHCLRIRSGVMFQRETNIPWRQVVTLSVLHSFHLKPVHAVRLRVDTLGGGFRDADFSILLTPRKARELLQFRQSKQHELPGHTYHPKTGSILSMALLNSNSLAGIVFMATFVYQSGRLLGGQFSDRLMDTFEEAARSLAFGIPPAAAALAGILLGSWLIGFFMTFVRYQNMVIARTDRGLDIGGGLFTQRQYNIAYEDVVFVDIRQSLTTRLLGLHSLYIAAVGYGKNKDDISCIIPTENQRQFEQLRKLLFPAYLPGERMLKASFTGIMRFLTDPLWFVGGIPATGLVIRYFAPAWSRFLLFVTLMLMAPALLLLVVRFLDFLIGGVSVRDGVLTMRYSRRFYLHTVVIPTKNVVQVRVVQGFFQRLGGKYCDLVVHTRGEGRTTHRCRSLRYEEVLQLFNIKPAQ